MIILWIYQWHDASACIIKDWKILVSIEKERLTREKHDVWNVSECINYCLKATNLSLDDIDFIATSKKVSDKSKDTLEIIDGKEYESNNEMFSAHVYKLFWKEIKWYSIAHHVCHGASAYYLSWFNNAWIVSMDWLGDFTATMTLRWKNNKLMIIDEYKANLWKLWTLFCTTFWLSTVWTAWTLMALWTLGSPKYRDVFFELYWPHEEFRLDYKRDKKEIYDEVYNWKYVFHKTATWWKGNYTFKDHDGVVYWIKEFNFVNKNNHLDNESLNVATSLQTATNEVVNHFINKISEIDENNICFTWWIALNCVTNFFLKQNHSRKSFFIPPFCNDAWLSIWAALFTYYHILENEYIATELTNCYFWKTYTENEINTALSKVSDRIDYIKLLDDDVFLETARLLKEWKIIWWFQDWSESWPRALWNRSILCNPWIQNMKDILNAKVKHRESYRPFAPSILKKYVSDRFDYDFESPFMLFVNYVKPEKKSVVPAITHLDWSARFQTVSEKNNKKYHKLLNTFNKITNIPILLNTSFNDREAIVETPQDALSTFLKTNIDCLVIWNFLITKK